MWSKFRPPIIKCYVMVTEGLTEVTCEEIISVKQTREMMMCQVRLRRMKVNFKPCMIDLSKQLQAQTCLPDMMQCGVMLRRLKIDQPYQQPPPQIHTKEGY